jgi:hypothetical protein
MPQIPALELIRSRKSTAPEPQVELRPFSPVAPPRIEPADVREQRPITGAKHSLNRHEPETVPIH